MITSPYIRALETAEIIAEQLDLPITIEPMIAERFCFTCDISSPLAELRARLCPPAAAAGQTQIDLHSLHVFNVDITYDGAALIVTITDTVTLASATQMYLVDLPRFIGGNFAYLGFTGGTGGLSATQDIHSLLFQAP